MILEQTLSDVHNNLLPKQIKWKSSWQKKLIYVNGPV